MDDGAEVWVGRHAFRIERVRLTVISAIAALYAAANVIGYRDTYPTLAERVRFAQAFRSNLALRLFYGVPHDLASVAGYAEFRLIGLLAVLSAGWGVFAAVRALRGEEDAGRYELMQAGVIGRGALVTTVLAVLTLECGVLWLAIAAALLVTGTAVGDVTAGQSIMIAAAAALPGVVFAMVGGLASQVASSRRGAQALGGALVAAALLLRIAADLGRGLGWLRWLTPLGWAENLRPVTGLNPKVLLLFLLAGLAVGWAAVHLASRRDLGSGLLAARRRPRSSDRLLGSPTQAAVRAELLTLSVWVVAAGLFAAIIGGFAESISEQARQSGLGRIAGEVTTVHGYLALSFVLFALVVSLFATSHIGALHDEESSGRLETLLALPVGRRSWIAGRIAVAAGSSIALGLLVGLLAWAGAATQDAAVAIGDGIAAGSNCIPVALCFLGIGSLIFAVWPRVGAGAALAVVGVGFLWNLVGGLVGAPGWLLAVSPFDHVAAVPLHEFDYPGGLGLLAVAAATALAAVEVFAHRDLRLG
jgi:ABC-2 type transport system permease protein